MPFRILTKSFEPDQGSFFDAMSQLRMNKLLEEIFCIHLFPISAAMVGVCLTVIGFTRVFISVRKIDPSANDLLAVEALLFLCSCLCAYWVLPRLSIRRRQRLEAVADLLFVRWIQERKSLNLP